VSHESIDDHTIGLIAGRVVTALREELEAIVVQLGRPNGSEPSLTVDDVAERLGVARSTVYAHWREWGGYKLGDGERSAIRFLPSTLPDHARAPAQPTRNGRKLQTARRRSRTRGRPILRGAPRLPIELGDEG
jgi:transposase-like protein